MEFANSPEELNELEAKYVTLTEICDPQCYNLKTGGDQNIVFSEETLKKISKAVTGIKRSEETKRKHCGAGNGMYGRKHSEETRKKMSEVQKGKKLSEEHKKKISEAFKDKRGYWFGKHLSKETKLRISESRKGKCCGEDSYWFGKHLTEETKKKISETTKKRFEDPEERRRISEALKGNHLSEETRKKLSKASKGRIWVNNTVEEILVFPDNIPAGYVRGRLKAVNML